MAVPRQLTIREVMGIVLFFAVSIAALKVGGLLASIVIALATIITTALAIIAFVGRSTLRSFAIGFLVPVIAYAASIIAVGKSELDPNMGTLPTTRLIGPCFEFMVDREYIDMLTNQPVPDYDPAANAGMGGGAFGGPAVLVQESLDRTTFMSLAHVLLAMVGGFVGAKFAVWIDLRQSGHPKQETGATS